MTREEANRALQSAKQQLDSQLISREEFDAIRKELAGKVQGNDQTHISHNTSIVQTNRAQNSVKLLSELEKAKALLASDLISKSEFDSFNIEPKQVALNKIVDRGSATSLKESKPKKNRRTFKITIISSLLCLGVIFVMIMMESNSENQPDLNGAESNQSENSTTEVAPASQDNQPEYSKGDTDRMNSEMQDQTRSINIEGFLIYKEGGLSDFNIIDNNQISLWNTFIGEGSAGNPSDETKIIVTIPNESELHTLQIKVTRKVPSYDSIGVVSYSQETEIFESGAFSPAENNFRWVFSINTYCGVYSIIVSHFETELLRKEVNFGCGE